MRYLVEYLPRIKKITVILDECVEPRLVQVKPLEVHIRENNSISIIKLPYEVELQDSLQLTEGTQGEYLLRLRTLASPLEKMNDVMSVPAGKWTKKDLNLENGFELNCLKCNTPVISTSNINKINELPSEFWMELMDYWHCHKPQVGDNELLDYSVGRNTLIPLTGELLVGNSFFLLLPSTLQRQAAMKHEELTCLKCNSILGDRTTEGLCRLYKWKLYLRKNDETDYFKPEDHVLLSMLEALKGNSERYTILKWEENVILLWLFSIDIGVTLSGGKVLKRAVKIFYTSDLAVIKKICDERQVEEIKVNGDVFDAFKKTIENVHDMLPQCSRGLGQWEACYLELFSSL
ncbi:hypothetical protein NCAS_0J02280 [Naumovozyma castellii]|uniref:Ubiquitin-conjugating enzyme E2C-binding protein n=1 Tax=Naumovozyma castellii TaxID=27288 RepID=G0VL18_NAUCA|nr:hypothetical protein NCAS_0J02280 [Naumovozyma castellii CBS 4309]CCC72207.1 hypothetical protein NCAS_0J02280 [Naumovozyma castellii CBS 4309]